MKTPVSHLRSIFLAPILFIGSLAFTAELAAQISSGPEPTLTIPKQQITFQSATEPTLSIPKDNPATCVGKWSKDDEYCVPTLTQALKNAKPGKTVFVKPGYGMAENLSISKAVTICSAKMETAGTATEPPTFKCIKTPSKKDQKFRLIPADHSKPCISISPRSGKIRFQGMILDDVSGGGQACIKSSNKKIEILIEHSTLKNVSLNLSGLKSVSIQNVSAWGSVNWTFNKLTSTAKLGNVYFTSVNLEFKKIENVTLEGTNSFSWANLMLKDVGQAAFKGINKFYRTDLKLDDTSADLAIKSFEDGNISARGNSSTDFVIGTFINSREDASSKLTISGTRPSSLNVKEFYNAELTIDENGAFDLFDSRFVKSTILIKGSAIRTINNNSFINTRLELEHNGLAKMWENNFVEQDEDSANEDGDGEGSDDEPFEPYLDSSILVSAGINHIWDNYFMAMCEEFPSPDGSPACECTLTPGIEFRSGKDKSTEFFENKVCTDEPEWVLGLISRDEDFYENCVITDDKSIVRTSRRLYKKAKEFRVTYAGSKRPSKEIQRLCGPFLRR